MPKITKSILWFLLNYRHPESMIGDYEEMYSELKNKKGFLYAWLWLWFQVLLAVPKYFTTSTYWGFAMFKNYLKISIRNIIKHKSFSFINIFGLAMGLTVSILIMLWVQDELSYDKYHEKAGNIYLSWLVVAQNDDPSQFGDQPTTSHELIKALEERFPEIENNARLFR
ncbi:ABC transporter permease, partial [Bacteroidota bacterium]